MLNIGDCNGMGLVTSLAEVWIEIVLVLNIPQKTYVTSLAEVWIEIAVRRKKTMKCCGHFPCGSVD